MCRVSRLATGDSDPAKPNIRYSSMKKLNTPLTPITTRQYDIPLPEGVRRWRRGIIAGSAIASGVAATGLALLYWKRHRRSKSFSYAMSTIDTLDVGSGVKLRIRFETVSHASLKISYPRALKRRVKVRVANQTLSINRLPCRNRWVSGPVLAELTLPYISRIRVVGDAQVIATGQNKLDGHFELLQIGGQIEGLTVDASSVECQIRGNAKSNLYIISDQTFMGYSGSPEMRVVLQSQGQAHLTATGSGQILLLGHTQHLSLTASDRSVVQAETLTATEADVLLADSATSQLSVADKLSYTLCNESKLLLAHQPKQILQAEILDAATLEILDKRR